MLWHRGTIGMKDTTTIVKAGNVASVGEAGAMVSSKLGSWLDQLILLVPNIVLAILVILVAVMLAKYVRRLAQKIIKRFTDHNSIVGLVGTLAVFVLGLLTTFLVLSIMDLSDAITKILATAGVVGLAIGLALQDPIHNLFSGVLMSVRDYYEIGDVVETNGYMGTIESINLRVTMIKSFDGQEVIIPNKSVISSPLVNYTCSGHRRVTIACGVGYGVDLSKAQGTVIDALQSLEGLVPDMPVVCHYDEFGGSGINFYVRVWIPSDGSVSFLDVKSDCIKVIKAAFDQEGIGIPFPIRRLDFGIDAGQKLSQAISDSQFTVNNN